MDLIYLIILLSTLAIDSFDITLSKGKSLKEDNIKENILICIIFSMTYMLMFIIGYMAGTLIEDIFSIIAQAFGIIIIIIIALKMIYDGFKKDSREDTEKFSVKKWGILALIGSIDFIAVGITIKTLGLDILEPIILIGIITFILPGLGILLGERLAEKIGNKFEAIGGAILILVAISILIGMF